MFFDLKKTAKRKVGDAAEDKALQHISSEGLRLITRNYCTKFGEIDLIAEDNDTLVFLEVRFRKNDHYGSALESVTTRKQKKITTTARYYLAENNIGESRPIRFDVVGITQNKIQWIKNAF